MRVGDLMRWWWWWWGGGEGWGDDFLDQNFLVLLLLLFVGEMVDAMPNEPWVWEGRSFEHVDEAVGEVRTEWVERGFEEFEFFSIMIDLRHSNVLVLLL